MEIGTLGQRLRYLRKRCRLSRKAIEDHFGISVNSLKNWEEDFRRIKPETLKKLIAIYKSYGVSSTQEWILGNQEEPLPFDISHEISEDSFIVKEINNFESFYEKSRVLQVEDEDMAPWIHRGDYVGGIITEGCFLNKVCIVETKTLGTLVRLVQKSEKEGLYNLISFTNITNLFNVPVERAYTVIWLRRRSYCIQ